MSVPDWKSFVDAHGIRVTFDISKVTAFGPQYAEWEEEHPPDYWSSPTRPPFTESTKKTVVHLVGGTVVALKMSYEEFGKTIGALR